jgi:antitoxin component YwqK of YwqJK toxin-antitoxin module
MKTNLLFIFLLGASLSSKANSFIEQMCHFNPNWKKYERFVPIENERVFLSDKQYIQTHLELVIQVLNSSDLKGLDEDQLANRSHLIAVLSDYRLQGVFPVNYYRSERIPVFIDEHYTHCAVGYLMKESGFENLALKISRANNYIWVKDLKDEEVIAWQQLSGFTLEELKLIQGAYDSYMPRLIAFEMPKRIEIPQKPEVISMNFKLKDLAQSNSKTGTNKIWIRGEGKNGILHGRWEQNYSPTLPWILGFYQNGNREGKWMEYYLGTDLLCRTEHWKDDKLNGLRTRFDRSGNVIEEIQFQDGNAILKTNYELKQSLKYVRKPLGENKVWTEVYDLGGRLLASGHETIHNPGNLQWFQNIELTALNSMSLASQTYTSTVRAQKGKSQLSQEVSPIRLFSEPQLVEYIKQGDWVYYRDEALFPDQGMKMDYHLWSQFLSPNFKRLGNVILTNVSLLPIQENLPTFDSLHVNYLNGNVNWLNGYAQKKRSRIEFEWYTMLNINPNRLRMRYDNISSIGEINMSFPIKSYGFVNENDEKINK